MIKVEFFKHPDTLHWNYEAELLGQDSYGIWLGVAAGTELRKGVENAKTMNGSFVQLIATGKWWTLVRNVGHRSTHYVDIITPAVWKQSDHVVMVDLDLDVVRLENGSVIVEDEDEFRLHQKTLRYPESWIDKARNTAAEVYLAVENREEPFGKAADEWSARFSRGA